MEYNLLGNSLQIKELNEIIKQVAPTNVSVLITGESGTGKELVANALHHYSRRADKPLIKVNCGAIPEGIIESELFGHQKGAFTGAIETREGYFEMADGGTIFLDEIGEMPVSTQVKILRVLESGEFMKVGGNKLNVVDVRIIAATNRNLSREVINKNFREDLYYRLKSVNLDIPPLRERKTDIKILFNHFINTFCKENNITFKGIEKDAMEYIENYTWKGNARELKNFCESIIVLNPDIRITINEVKKHLQTEIHENNKLPAISYKSREQTERDFLMRALFEIKTDIMNLKNLIEQSREEIRVNNNDDNDFILSRERITNMKMDEIEKEVLTYLLDLYKWNINKVSDTLGQTSRNIYRKINKYRIMKYE